MTDQKKTVEWYFDFISPYAYLQHEQLKAMDGLSISYKPVLFAGLLKHWSHLGPAEIPAKRVLTYQYCHWYAEKLGISFRTPPSHPFNPLPPLRLAVSQNNNLEVIDRIFDTIWGQGLDIGQPEVWTAMVEQLGINDAETAVSQQWVKDQLKANTEQGIEKGLFGVPTIFAEGKLFWGHDMTEMALEHLNDPTRFTGGEYQRMENLPIAQARKQSRI